MNDIRQHADDEDSAHPHPAMESGEPDVVLEVLLRPEEAWTLAQFLKRVAFIDYMNNAIDKEEAYAMLYAGEKVRAALKDIGFAPR